MGVVPKPGDRSSCMAHSLVVAPGLGVYILSAISEFLKWRKYLILLSFLDNSSARPVQIGGVDVNICHSRVDRSPRTPAVQFAIPPRGDHFVAHGRALWKLTGRGRTERAHRAVENAVRFPRASTGPFPSSHPRKLRKAPKYRWETRIDPVFGQYGVHAHLWRARESRPRHRPEHGQADSARPRDRTGSRAGPTNAVEGVLTGALGRPGRLRSVHG